MSIHVKHAKSRRDFLKLAGGATAAVTVISLLPGTALAQALPHLAPSDPSATALSYVEDASKAANRHTPNDTCANCNFFQGKAGDAYGPCQLFPGKAVASKGWCVSHTPKA